MVKIFHSLVYDLGVDLGTANTLVHVKGKGIVVHEPSVVAVVQSTGAILAVGNEAKNMLGRTPGDIVALRPLRDGVIADFDITQHMLEYFIRKSGPFRSFIKLRLVIGVPSQTTEVEKRAVISAATQAGAREVYLIEEPMAAAIGAGVPVGEPNGNMVVDIGGGTTDVAVVSLGGIVTSQAIRIGGDEMDEAIRQYIKRVYNLLIGERTAEEIKIAIGSAQATASAESAKIRGRDILTGMPKELVLSAVEVQQALIEPVTAIVEAVQLTLERTPPELVADIIGRGIILTGGGALLKGLDTLLASKTGIPVYIADEPLHCVARGTGKALENLRALKQCQRR